jgi:hypothetical protein
LRDDSLHAKTYEAAPKEFHQFLAAIPGRGNSRNEARVRLAGDRRSDEAPMVDSNYVGSHYGRSLFSITDPFYMLILIENLGREYIVWDKSSCIRFCRPAKGTVTAKFCLTEAPLDEIRAAMRTQEKIEPTFAVEIRDADGTVVAEGAKSAVYPAGWRAQRDMLNFKVP